MYIRINPDACPTFPHQLSGDAQIPHSASFLRKKNMHDMHDKVALVTGASSGIGRATAMAFAKQGAKVALAARRTDALQQLQQEISLQGGVATMIKTDVAVHADIRRMVSHAIETYGRLDFAVNSAGTEGQWNSLIDLPEEEWDRVMNINLKGTFLCLKHESKAMLETGGGAIVNIGSINSFLGFSGGSAYVASKHALIGLTSSASAELASQGVRVNLICPGFIETPMHDRVEEKARAGVFAEKLMPRVHLKRTGTAEEIAKTVLFLCSSDASYITGTTLTPDGGFTMTT